MTNTLILTAALIGSIALPGLTMADTPNRTTMSFDEFVLASGCSFVVASDGTTRNAVGPNGGGCDAIVAFTGVGTRIEPGADGILGTADDRRFQDN